MRACVSDADADGGARSDACAAPHHADGPGWQRAPRQDGSHHHQYDKRVKSCFSRRMQELRHRPEKQVRYHPPKSEEGHYAENRGYGYIHAMTNHGFPPTGSPLADAALASRSLILARNVSAIWQGRK